MRGRERTILEKKNSGIIQYFGHKVRLHVFGSERSCSAVYWWERVSTTQGMRKCHVYPREKTLAALINDVEGRPWLTAKAKAYSGWNRQKPLEWKTPSLRVGCFPGFTSYMYFLSFHLVQPEKKKKMTWRHKQILHTPWYF